MHDIRWVLFDLGGIFVAESGDAIAQAVARELGVPQDRLMQAAQPYLPRVTRGEMTLREGYRALIDDLGADASPEAALEVHLRLFRELSTTHDPDAVALVGRLRGRFRVAALTNTEPEVADICRATGLFDYFERWFTSVGLGLAKPDPEIYRVVARELDCPPACIFFTDDRRENVEGARAAGMQGALWHGADDLERRLG